MEIIQMWYLDSLVEMLTVVELTVLHEGSCTWMDSPCLRCKEPIESVPVCGSDGITYTSFAALSCVARSRDPGIPSFSLFCIDV